MDIGGVQNPWKILSDYKSFGYYFLYYKFVGNLDGKNTFICVKLQVNGKCVGNSVV